MKTYNKPRLTKHSHLRNITFSVRCEHNWVTKDLGNNTYMIVCSKCGEEGD